jgi:hypothetical protein
MLKMEGTYSSSVKNVENGGHLFFKCKKVKALWTMMLLEEQRRSLAQIGFAKEAVQYIMNQKTKEKLKIVVLLWSWWSERNNVREGNSPKEARQIRRSVEVYTAKIMQIVKKKPSKIFWQNHKWNRPV